MVLIRFPHSPSTGEIIRSRMSRMLGAHGLWGKTVTSDERAPHVAEHPAASTSRAEPDMTANGVPATVSGRHSPGC